MRRFVRFALLFYAFVALAAWGWATLFGHADRLLGDRAPSPAALGLGAAAGLAVVAASHVAHRTSTVARRLSDMLGGLLGRVGAGEAALLAAASGFAEELMFRGALWPQLGLWGTSTLFAVLHTLPVRPVLAYPVFAFLAGVMFGFLRQETGSVWPPALAHFIVNALNLAWLGRATSEDAA